MAGKTIGELSESVSLDNTNLLAVSSDGNVLKKTTLSTLENSLTASNFNATSKATIAGLAMPSNNYVNLTLGASGATYTAPAAGYYTLWMQGNTVGQFVDIYNSTANVRMQGQISTANAYCIVFVPVSKNDIVQIIYNTVSNANFTFTYATGTAPSA